MKGLFTVSLFVLCGIVHHVFSATTTPSPEVHPDGEIPECKFDIALSPDLLCRRLDKESQDYYALNQKFCACPSFSICVTRDVPDPNIPGKNKKIFLCDRETSNDPEWLDMTDGLLREAIK